MDKYVFNLNRLVRRTVTLVAVLLLFFLMPINTLASGKSHISFLTEDEKRWIDAHKVLRVGIVRNYQPFCDMDESGKVDGVVEYIVETVVDKISYADRIEVRYVAYDNFQDMAEGLKNGDVDISFPIIGEKYYLDELGIKSTTEIINVPMYVAYLGEYSENIYDVIALNARPIQILKQYYSDSQILHLETPQDCLDAVLDGRATCTVMASYKMDEYLMNSKYRGLSTAPVGESLAYCLGLADGDNTLLYLMNKVVFRIDKAVVSNKIWEDLNSHRIYTSKDFIEENLAAIIWGGLIILGLIITVLSLSLSKEASSRRGMEIALQRAEAFSKSYFASWEVDVLTDTITPINTPEYAERICNQAGYKASEAMKIFVDDFVMEKEHKRQMDQFLNIENVALRLFTKDSASIEYKGVINGWSRLTVVPERKGEDGSVISYLIGIRVIQEEKKLLEEALRKAEEANRAKSTFLFNMSHDIRTPMNAIMGFTDLLEKHLDDPEMAVNYIEKIKSSNEFLLSLVNNVLEMARIESGKMVLEENYWNAEDLNDSIFNVFYDTMKKKGITFERKADITHVDVLCDATKLREVFLNLISNAAKYTPSGGNVKMFLTELPSDDPSFAVYQTVIEDNGIGMSKEFVEHIYDEFSRERNSTESKVEGTGLGMAIVKKLVDLMHGTIDIESELGKGTKITVVFHHRIATQSDILKARKKELYVGDFDFMGKRILLAEDNDLNAEIAITVLEDAGFVVERAADGQECIDMMEAHEAKYYDLILMDVQMPILDGYETTRNIRVMEDEDKANIIILAMTANAFSEDKINAIDAGMNGHLAKPINIPTLLATLAKYLTR